MPSTQTVPVDRLLDEARRVIDRADEQQRDLNDVEAVKVETLLDLAERFGRRLPTIRGRAR